MIGVLKGNVENLKLLKEMYEGVATSGIAVAGQVTSQS